MLSSIINTRTEMWELIINDVVLKLAGVLQHKNCDRISNAFWCTLRHLSDGRKNFPPEKLKLKDHSTGIKGTRFITV